MKTIDERIHDFKIMVWEWVKKNDPKHEKYPIWMLKEFVSKYTETTKGGRKFKFETCKTWDTGKRLATWKSNSEQWHPKKWDIKKDPPKAKYKPIPMADLSQYPEVNYNNIRISGREGGSVGSILKRKLYGE